MNTHIEEDICADPTGKLPNALVKALVDPFSYALGLRNGQVIHFQEAQMLEGEQWIRLIGFGGTQHDASEGSIEMPGVDHHFPRGIDIRISDIMWVADAPDGS